MTHALANEHRRRFLTTSALLLSSAAIAGPALAREAQSSSAALGVSGPAVIHAPDMEGVTVERVTYLSRNNGATLVANLFRPAGLDTARKYAGIVVTHPIGAVKEQAAGLYALKLAQQGYITLAFDAAYQGESGGEPRLMELPASRVEDISCAIDFLSAHPQVDPDRIGSLGICGGGGYALNSAQTEERVRAVASVSAADIGSLRRDGLGGSRSPEERATLLRDASAQRSREARGEPLLITPSVPENASGFTNATPDLYREGFDYYRTARGQHPNAVARSVFSTLPAQMQFIAFDLMDTISPRPVLMIAGSRADTRYFSERAYERAAEPKELVLIPGATHVDMYDKPEYVTPAIEKLTAFFGQHLASA